MRKQYFSHFIISIYLHLYLFLNFFNNSNITVQIYVSNLNVTLHILFNLFVLNIFVMWLFALHFVCVNYK